MTYAEEHETAALRATDLARDIITSRRPETLTQKTDRDFATDIDYEVERRVRDYLRTATPDIGFLGEEDGPTGVAPGRAYWAFDPVDGTSNLAHGLPLCATSLGLIVDGSPVLGIVDLPFLHERFTATQGHGAFLNGEPIHARTNTNLDAAIIAIGDYAVGPGSDTKNAPRFAITQALAGQVERIRMLGSAAIDLTWTAAGRIDGSVMLANKAWDVAAGVIIAREAGALVLDCDGTPHSPDSAATICVTSAIADELAALLSEIIGRR